VGRAPRSNNAEMCSGDWVANESEGGEGDKQLRFKMADYPRMLDRDVVGTQRMPESLRAF